MALNKEEILKKIEAGKKLSHAEEMFYLTKILGYSETEAGRILAITENKEKNVIID